MLQRKRGIKKDIRLNPPQYFRRPGSGRSSQPGKWHFSVWRPCAMQISLSWFPLARVVPMSNFPTLNRSYPARPCTDFSHDKFHLIKLKFYIKIINSISKIACDMTRLRKIATQKSGPGPSELGNFASTQIGMRTTRISENRIAVSSAWGSAGGNVVEDSLLIS